MKRVLLLLTLCLASVGITKAASGDAVSTLDGISSSKVYAVNSARGAWTLSGTSFQQKTTTQNTNDPMQWFVFESDTDNSGKYFIKTVDGRYLNLDTANGGIFIVSDTKSTSYTITTTGNTSYPFFIKYSDALNLNANGSSNMNFDAWTTIDDGNSWSFTEVVDLETDDTKYFAAYVKATAALSEANANVGTVFGYTQDAVSTFRSTYDQYSSNNTLNNKPSDVTAATTALNDATTTLQSSAKAEVTDGVHVLLGNLQHTSLYMRAKETNRNGVGGGWLGSYGNKDNYRYLFTFKKNTDGTWKIYSDYYGKYVGAIPSQNNLEFQLVDESSAGSYTVEAAATAGYAVIYDSNCTTTSGSTTVNALHMTDWSSSGITGNGVVRWGKSANASQFKLIIATDAVLNAWNTTLTTEAAKTGTAIGYYENTEALQTALSEFNSADTDTKGVKAKALEDALAAAAIVPQAGKYYTIRHAVDTDVYMTESYTSKTGDNDNVLAAALAANRAPSLWKFEATSNSIDKFNNLYKVVAANSGSYVSKIQWTYQPLQMLASGNSDIGSFDFFDKKFVTQPDAVTFTYYTDAAHSDRGTANKNSDGTIGSWNDTNSGANNWVIEEAATIPVTISAAGYATLNLPFAVTLPADGSLKAYKGTDAGDYITLTEISGTIPAEEPVILTGDAATYTLTIVYDAAAKSTDNALSGTLIPATVAADASAYILKNGGRGVAMYLINDDSDRTIPANKAYLGSTTSTSSVKAFKFGGESTGINSAVTAPGSDAVFYDLNGRRVLYPAHGVYVKSNGQKVYIK